MPSPAPPAPIASDLASFQADPLAWLTQARSERGPVVVLRGAGAVFSRMDDCQAVAAVFGADNIRQVLTDGVAFAMPASAATKLDLPPRLAQLNRSLHSMHEPEHGAHKRALGALLGATAVDPAAAERAMQACTAPWPRQSAQPLLARMRELSLCLAAAALLAPGAAPTLAPLLQRYFLLRREAASPAGADLRTPLLAAGNRLDAALRHALRAGGGRLAGLLRPEATAGVALTEDEAVGHANILFVSATEPVAVALTWMLLLLSQQPGLQRRLRDDPVLLDAVVLESLRLLPPNGFMVRSTTRPVRLGGVSLPARSELMLCPVLSHRDADVFPRPDSFLPQRWQRARPTPFAYFPFGAGGHACVGRSLGMGLLRSALAFLVQRFDTVLDADQAVDWRIHVMFMPRQEITVRFAPPGTATGGGRWRGPVAALVDLGV